MTQKKHLFDDPKNVSRLIRSLAVMCATLFALDFVLDRHTSHPLESVPGFYAIYGFIGCVVLVVVAKGMRHFLMRSEDYYDNDLDNNLDSNSQKNGQENALNTAASTDDISVSSDASAQSDKLATTDRSNNVSL